MQFCLRTHGTLWDHCQLTSQHWAMVLSLCRFLRADLQFQKDIFPYGCSPGCWKNSTWCQQHENWSHEYQWSQNLWSKRYQALLEYLCSVLPVNPLTHVPSTHLGLPLFSEEVVNSEYFAESRCHLAIARDTCLFEDPCGYYVADHSTLFSLENP